MRQLSHGQLKMTLENKVAVVSTRNDLQTQTVMLKKKYGGKHCSEPKST